MGIRNNLSYIFAHRGLPNVYMENSLTGLNKALEHCEYVETDIRLTKDNNLLLFHDPYICLLYTSPSPRDVEECRMPSSA